jgi:trigger factor
MNQTALQTSSERLDKDRVKMRVEVPEPAFAPALDAVYRRWANEIKVPGFRKGKVPRRLIDQRVGPEAVREEALRDAIPDLYRKALEVEEVEAIAPPEIEVVEFEAGAPLVFEATVDIRPEVPLPDLSQIRVDAPPSEVTEADVDEQLEALRDRFAELETVTREARRGDHVLIDLKGYQHEEEVEGASAPDYLYEVGSRSGPPKLDDELEGSRPGAILKFTDTMPGGELEGQDISFTVLVKEVKAKKLPPLDDELAKTVGEFDSLNELREDLKSRLVDVKRSMVEDQIRALTLEALVDTSDFEPPEKLVEGEFEHRRSHLDEDLKNAGVSMDQYTRSAGTTELELRSDLRKQAARAVKAELLLEEVSRDQSIDVSSDELGREIAIAAARAGRDPKEVTKEVASSGRLGAIAADIMRRKALDHVVQEADVIGRPEPQQTGEEEESRADSQQSAEESEND